MLLYKSVTINIGHRSFGLIAMIRGLKRELPVIQGIGRALLAAADSEQELIL